MHHDASDDPYAQIAELYEAEHRNWTDDLGLYLALAARAGGPVLELGCGSGRVTIALAKAGHEVHGIDSSAAMLAIARDKLAQRNLPVTFTLGDMRRFERQRDVGLVICALDTLLHLPSADDVRDTLAAAHAVLRAGGLLAIDVVHPSPDLLAMRDGVVRRQSTFAGPGGTHITHFVSWDVDPDAQTIDARHFYDWMTGAGFVQRRTTSFRLRYIRRGEAEDGLRAAGFGDVELYGNAQLDRFEPDSDRMIFVATRTGE